MSESERHPIMKVCGPIEDQANYTVEEEMKEATINLFGASFVANNLPTSTARYRSQNVFQNDGLIT